MFSRRKLNVPRGLLDLLIRLGIPFVLAIATLMGGLLNGGWLVAAGILLVAISLVLGNYWISHRGSNLPPVLRLSSDTCTRPLWLLNRHELADGLHELLKASLLLLACDRTESGFWGKTYLYRRAITNSGIPLAG